MKKYFVFAAIAVVPWLRAVDENSPMLKEFLQTAATFPADNPAELCPDANAEMGKSPGVQNYFFQCGILQFQSR